MLDFFIKQNIINPHHNLDEIREEFIKNRYVVIRDFLKEEYAEELYYWFSNDMPSDWWFSSSTPRMNGEKGFEKIQNTEENLPLIAKTHQYVFDKMFEGQFSYHFHRTMDDHTEVCTCTECGFRRWTNSKENINFLNSLVEEPVSYADSMFAAAYLPNDFLSPHVDSPNGRLGYVYQLTKNWKPQYGGNLHFMSDYDTIDEVSIPEFNTLTLFDLPEGEGKLHYVSTVSPGVQELRLTYTGWFE
jgi:SM-20-related protein